MLCGLTAFQIGPFYEFFSSVPVLRSTKLMRVLQFVAFGLAVLGALGLDRLGRGRSWVVLAVFLGIAGEQRTVSAPSRPRLPEDTNPIIDALPELAGRPESVDPHCAEKVAESVSDVTA